MEGSKPIIGLSKPLIYIVAIFALCLPTLAQDTNSDGSKQNAASRITAAEITSAQQFGQSLGIADWLGAVGSGRSVAILWNRLPVRHVYLR